MICTPTSGGSRQGCQPEGGDNLLFGQNLPKTAWKLRKLDWGRPKFYYVDPPPPTYIFMTPLFIYYRPNSVLFCSRTKYVHCGPRNDHSLYPYLLWVEDGQVHHGCGDGRMLVSERPLADLYRLFVQRFRFLMLTLKINKILVIGCTWQYVPTLQLVIYISQVTRLIITPLRNCPV